MSSPMKRSFDEASAVKFNTKYAPRIGYVPHMPARAVRVFPGLAFDPVSGKLEEKQAFARAVLDFQRENFKSWKDQDGKLGNGTWKQLKAVYADKPARRLIWNGQDHKVPARKTSEIITWEDPGGFDFHPIGGYRAPKEPGTRKIDRIVVHWGGTSPKRCFKTLSGKKISSHFGIEGTKIYQWLDLDMKGYHAGKANTGSVGIDICQQPGASWLDYLHDKRGFTDVEVIANPSSPRRGDRKVVTLHDKTAQSVRDLLEDLCFVLGIPLEVPRNEDGSYDYSCWEEDRWKAFSGILGHHHSSPGKWDTAPWWPQIFDPMFA